MGATASNMDLQEHGAAWLWGGLRRGLYNLSPSTPSSPPRGRGARGTREPWAFASAAHLPTPSRSNSNTTCVRWPGATIHMSDPRSKGTFASGALADRAVIGPCSTATANGALDRRASSATFRRLDLAHGPDSDPCPLLLPLFLYAHSCCVAPRYTPCLVAKRCRLPACHDELRVRS